MSKFAKTSYSRPSTHGQNLNFNNFLQVGNEKRERLYSRQKKGNMMKKMPSNDLQDLPNSHKIEPQYIHHQQPLHNLIEKKIQIDPMLLFSNKAHSRADNRFDKNKKTKKNYQRNFSQTATDGFQYKSQERPQSKQEPRSRLTGSGIDKYKEKTSERPQTSKGVRTKIPQEKNKRLTLEQDNEVNIQIKKSKYPQSASSKRSSQARQIQLQTSIDPEFLALFAS